MALEHLGQLRDPPCKAVVVSRMRDAPSADGPDVVAHRSWIEAGDVADDRPRLLKLAHPVGDGRLREPDGGGDVHLRRLRVGLEEIEDLIIYRVKGHSGFLKSDKERFGR